MAIAFLIVITLFRIVIADDCFHNHIHIFTSLNACIPDVHLHSVKSLMPNTNSRNPSFHQTQQNKTNTHVT